MARKSITTAGTLTFPLANVIAQEVVLNAEAQEFDSTPWAAGFYEFDNGTTTYDGTFTGHVDGGVPADPGGDSAALTVGFDAAIVYTFARTGNDDGAYVDTWTMTMDAITGEVTINGHIAINIAYS